MAIQARLYSENLAFPFDDSQNLIESARGLNDLYLFNLNHHHQQQYDLLPHGNQSSCFPNEPISLQPNIQYHNQDIEGLISLQNERLRLALETHRKQQLLTILKNYESKSKLLLGQKEQEINRARNRRIELEEYLKRTENERQKWQIATKESEAIVTQLNKTIEAVISDQNMMKGCEDEGSCCYENNNENMKMVCKSCFNEDSCVVMLPCRHLCSCESCDVLLQSCPVCKMVKKASIQVSLFDSAL